MWLVCDEFVANKTKHTEHAKLVVLLSGCKAYNWSVLPAAGDKANMIANDTIAA